MAEVTLPAAVAPGESTTLTIAWTSHVPRTFARTGVIGDFYFLGQWFPKIGVLEDSGWNCHQFHAATEFFSDFGGYDVRLTVPAGWTVGATGVEQGRRDAGNGTDHPSLRSRPTSTTSRGRRARTTSSGRRPSASDAAAGRHAAAAPAGARGAGGPALRRVRATLRYYGEWFGPYPYRQITIVDPAWQSGAGGMEYPTLFTAGTRWLAPASQ